MDTRIPILARQLIAARAVIGSLQAQLDAMGETIDAILTTSATDDAPPPCPHDEYTVIGSTSASANSLGDPIYRCRACGYEWIGVEIPT